MLISQNTHVQIGLLYNKVLGSFCLNPYFSFVLKTEDNSAIATLLPSYLFRCYCEHLITEFIYFINFLTFSDKISCYYILLPIHLAWTFPTESS